MMRRSSAAAAAAAIAVAVAMAMPTQACIFMYGSAKDSLAAPKGGTPWTHGMLGDDWTGVDAAGKPWACPTGLKQSPIDIVPETGRPSIAKKLQTRWRYPTLVSNGSNVEVINNGHVIQVEWPGVPRYASAVTIAVPDVIDNSTRVTSVLGLTKDDKVTRVLATPLQFHFHAGSEHFVEGVQYPLEMHIVHRVTDLPACAAGCFSVLGVFFKLVMGPDNPLLDSIWEAMPMREGEVKFLAPGRTIELDSFLPASTKETKYATYEGSLTTPPCSEGLLWHVLNQPLTISPGQLKKFQMAIAFKDCHEATNGTTTHGHRHHRRALLGGASAGNYTCEVAALGYNYRMPQPLNGRIVKYNY